MITESNPLPVQSQALRAIAFGPALVRARTRKQKVTIDTLLKISLEISCAVSGAKLANSLLDVSYCAEHMLKDIGISRSEIESVTEFGLSDASRRVRGLQVSASYA